MAPHAVLDHNTRTAAMVLSQFMVMLSRSKVRAVRSKKTRWKTKKNNCGERHIDGHQEMLFEIGNDAEQIIAFIRR